MRHAEFFNDESQLPCFGTVFPVVAASAVGVDVDEALGIDPELVAVCLDGLDRDYGGQTRFLFRGFACQNKGGLWVVQKTTEHGKAGHILHFLVGNPIYHFAF